MQIVGAGDVRLGVRTREHDHRNLPERGFGFDRGEDVRAAHAGQVEVEQYQVRTRAFGVLVSPVDEIERRLAGRDGVDLAGDVGVRERFGEQPGVARVGVDEQNHRCALE